MPQVKNMTPEQHQKELERKRAYREANREKLNEYSKFYNNRYKCVCGAYISDGNPKEKHEQTITHQDFILFGPKYQRHDAEQIERFKSHWAMHKRETKNFATRCDCGELCNFAKKDEHIKSDHHLAYIERQKDSDSN